MDLKSALCAGGGALAMYLLLKSSSGKKEAAPAAPAPAKKQTDSISVVCMKEHTVIIRLHVPRLSRSQLYCLRRCLPSFTAHAFQVNAGDKVYLPFETLAKITTECLVAAGVPAQQAATVADVLVTADARNVPSHGVNRLEMYLSEIAAGDIDLKAQPTIAAESDSTAKVDGRNALGACVRACVPPFLRFSWASCNL